MTELFNDIPEHVKIQARFWADFALKQPHAIRAAEMMAEYANSCANEYEKTFVDFYFNMRLEQLLNENISD